VTKMAARQWAARIIFLMARLGLAANDYGRLLVSGYNMLRVFLRSRVCWPLLCNVDITYTDPDPGSGAFLTLDPGSGMG
jgi:hypothetical protein